MHACYSVTTISVFRNILYQIALTDDGVRAFTK